MIVSDGPEWIFLWLYYEINPIFEYALEYAQLPPLIGVIVCLSEYDWVISIYQGHQVHTPRI